MLNYGSSSPGSATQLAGQLFQAMSQTRLVAVPFKGIAQAMVATMAGEVQVVFPTISTGMPQVKAGRLRALAVTTERPTPLAPGLPTVNESGLPGYESSVTYAVFAPARTPANVIDTLNRAIVRHLQAPAIMERTAAAGIDVIASSPKELASVMKQDMDRMGKLIRESRLSAQQ